MHAAMANAIGFGVAFGMTAVTAEAAAAAARHPRRTSGNSAEWALIPHACHQVVTWMTMNAEGGEEQTPRTNYHRTHPTALAVLHRHYCRHLERVAVAVIGQPLKRTSSVEVRVWQAHEMLCANPHPKEA